VPVLSPVGTPSITCHPKQLWKWVVWTDDAPLTKPFVAVVALATIQCGPCGCAGIGAANRAREAATWVERAGHGQGCILRDLIVISRVSVWWEETIVPGPL
jgi:hypothetical protein